jgi:hypothetical protein
MSHTCGTICERRWRGWDAPSERRGGRRQRVAESICFSRTKPACERASEFRRRTSARNPRLSPSLHHDGASFGRLIGQPNSGNRCASPTFLRTDVDEEDLVLVVMNDASEPRTQLDQRAMRQLASKDGELDVFAVALHQLEHLPQAFGIADGRTARVGGGRGSNRHASGLKSTRTLRPRELVGDRKRVVTGRMLVIA